MKKIIILLTSCIGFLTACKKTTDPIDVSNANVELKNAGTPVLHYYTMGLSEATKSIAKKVF